jgi:chromosome segregation ATPase
LDEAQKKLDRTQRALEAEKQKSAQFSARALSAERELGKADPIIKDLEMKVETVMKTSNQAKKEVESLKQRLVQADAEKNRIQNELMKAQAQIATLMKRHAS